MRQFLGVFLAIYTLISTITFIIGLAYADFKYTGCAVKTRIEYAFPTYRLGCYLNEPMDKN